MLAILIAVSSCFYVSEAQKPFQKNPGYVAAAAPVPECETIKGQRCVFPFTYKGKKYYECTHDGTTNGAAWCAYETRLSGEAVPGKWEDCDPSVCQFDDNVCHTESGPDIGNSCKFPFRFNGQTYYSCARWTWAGDHYGKYWCSTKTDRFGNHVNGQGNYGFCGFCDNAACGCKECSELTAGQDQRISFQSAAVGQKTSGGSSPN